MSVGNTRKVSDRVLDLEKTVEALEETVKTLETENEDLKQKLLECNAANQILRSDMDSIPVNLSSVPDYLQRGEYYRSLSDSGESEGIRARNSNPTGVFLAGASVICVPKSCFKISTEITSIIDLHNLLCTLRYWLIGELPDTVIAYALEDETWLVYEHVAREFLCDLPELDKLYKIGNYDDSQQSERLVTAIEENASVQILQYLFENSVDSQLDDLVMDTAIKYGSLPSLKYLISSHSYLELGTRLCDIATRGGYLDCLKYLHEHGCPWNDSTCNAAALHGHFNCLLYAHQHGCDWYESRMTIFAAIGGSIECLKYVMEQGCTWDAMTCASAAWSGQLQLLKYAHENGCPWNSTTCAHAAECTPFNDVVRHYGYDSFVGMNDDSGKGSDHLGCLQYAHEHGCPLPDDACRTAARKGYFSCLEFAHEHGCGIPNDPLYAYGHVDCFRYLHEHGSMMSKETCQSILCNGYFDCLVYYHEHGGTWYEGCCQDAMSSCFIRDDIGNHVKCLKYLHEHGCPWPQNKDILQSSRREIFLYAVENGHPVDADVAMHVAGGGDLEKLMCLHKNGCPWDSRAATETCEGYTVDYEPIDNVECLAYLYENGCPIEKELVNIARENRAHRCLQYLLEHVYPPTSSYSSDDDNDDNDDDDDDDDDEDEGGENILD